MARKPPESNRSTTPPAPALSGGYFERSQRPLAALVFLVPLIVAYEVGLLLWAGNQDIVARGALRDFFQSLGVSGRHLPGLIVVAVLLGWHVAGKYPWRFEWRLMPGMLAESCAWTAPLMMIMLLLARHAQAPAPAAVALAAGGLDGVDWQSKLVFSIGAGIYEELLFRLIAIAALHFLLVDVFKVPHVWGAAVAVLGSAVAFALYHFSDANPFHVARFIFYTVAGVYFALVYLGRGFGIAVGVHAMYDVFVVGLQAMR